MDTIHVNVDETLQTLDSVKEHLLSTSDSVAQQQYTATDTAFVEAQKLAAQKTAALTKESTAALDTVQQYTKQLTELTDTSASEVDNAEGRGSSTTHYSASVPAATVNLAAFDTQTFNTTAITSSAATEEKSFAQYATERTPSSDTTLSTASSTPSSPATPSTPAAATSQTSPSSPATSTLTSPAPAYTPEVRQAPAPSSFQDVVRTFAPRIQESYPPAPAPTAASNALREVLFSQNESEGSRQPAGTVRLTQEQLRVVAEAIAENINSQQEVTAAGGGGQAGAPATLAGGPLGVSVSSSEDYHVRVLDLCNQLANHQPPIPYAWGGGTISGPSQGIRDGGYADACGDYAKIGFDCSGLSRYVTYQTQGVEIPRVSQAQFAALTPVAQPMIGDLGFPGGGSPGHVVVYVGGGKVFEAQQSGTYLMYSPVQAGYVFGRTQNSPNWAIEQSGSGQGY